MGRPRQGPWGTAMYKSNAGTHDIHCTSERSSTCGGTCYDVRRCPDQEGIASDDMCEPIFPVVR
eukprot:5188926-Pyramimonas_sp.AAC.1